MRVATATQFDRSIDLIQRRQQSLQGTQDQLVSGKRITRASDDPVQAARAERALAQDARLEARQKSLESSLQTMGLTESALGDALGIMQRMRELVVQAGNGATGDANRKVLATELRGLREQLLGIANQQDGLGAYLFAGQGGTGEPFVQGPGGVEFKGVALGMAATASDELPLYLDGAATWMQAPTGNGVFATSYAGAVAPAHNTQMWINAGQVVSPSALTGQGYELSFTGSVDAGYTVSVERDDGNVQTFPYVSGQALQFDGLSVTLTGSPTVGQDIFKIEPSSRSLSPFGVADGLIADLEKGGRTGAQVAQTVANGLRDLDSTLGMLTAARSQLGWRMEQAEGLDERLSDGRLAAQMQRSAAEDVNMAEAVSAFKAQQTSYDSALKTYSMVQRMSLFEYIR
ncbi:MAG: flagellar hook-associated protein FlgL [Rubrivivax sp.]|jgi:flagellar hook-associated protein 3 FlgL